MLFDLIKIPLSAGIYFRGAGEGNGQGFGFGAKLFVFV